MTTKRRVKRGSQSRNKSENQATFVWDAVSTNVAIDLSEGYTIKEVASRNKINPRTIYRWRQLPEFDKEVDKLTFMFGISTKAERIRLAKRAVRQAIGLKRIKTHRDLLEWLKYSREEMEGLRIGLTDELLAIIEGRAKPTAEHEDDRSVAGSGSE